MENDHGTHEEGKSSYISCIKKPSKDTNLKNAMRYAISNQILEYKNSYEKDNLICETCNSKDEIQVDHVILFKQLYYDFENKMK